MSGLTRLGTQVRDHCHRRVRTLRQASRCLARSRPCVCQSSKIWKIFCQGSEAASYTGRNAKTHEPRLKRPRKKFTFRRPLMSFCTSVLPALFRCPTSFMSMATQLAQIEEVERISPLVIRILGGNPGKFTLQGQLLAGTILADAELAKERTPVRIFRGHVSLFERNIESRHMSRQTSLSRRVPKLAMTFQTSKD